MTAIGIPAKDARSRRHTSIGASATYAAIVWKLGRRRVEVVRRRCAGRLIGRLGSTRGNLGARLPAPRTSWSAE